MCFHMETTELQAQLQVITAIAIGFRWLNKYCNLIFAVFYTLTYSNNIST